MLLFAIIGNDRNCTVSEETLVVRQGDGPPDAAAAEDLGQRPRQALLLLAAGLALSVVAALRHQLHQRRQRLVVPEAQAGGAL